MIGGVLPVAIYFAVRRLPLGDAAAIFFSGIGNLNVTVAKAFELIFFLLLSLSQIRLVLSNLSWISFMFQSLLQNFYVLKPMQALKARKYRPPTDSYEILVNFAK